MKTKNNKEKRSVGRVGKPRRYDVLRKGDIKLVEKLIDQYFIKCFGNEDGTMTDGKYNEAPTMLGLALSLNLYKPELYSMLKREDEISILIKRAQQRIESFCEQQLMRNPRQVAMIFAMKNWWGWNDKKEIDANITGNITVSFGQVTDNENDNVDEIKI